MDCIIYMENGEIKNLQVIRKMFRNMKDGTYRVQVDIKKKRSNSQNSYLHAVLIPCFREALYEAGYDEVRTDSIAKQIMKEMFLKSQVVNKQSGEVVEYVRDTSDLSVSEMNDLFEQVFKFTAESLNYIIPSPGQQAAFL